MTAKFWEQWLRNRGSDENFIYINTPHYHARISKHHDLPVYNEAIYLREDEEHSIGEVIDEVTALYQSKNKSFVVGVCDHNPIDNMGSYLKQHGFKRGKSFDRRVAPVKVLLANQEDQDEQDESDQNGQEETKNDIRVESIPHERMLREEYLKIPQQCFPDFFPTLEAARDYMKRNIEKNKNSDQKKIINFAAYIRDKPVGTAALMYDTDLDNLAELSGASVLPEYRRQGVYTALLHKRAQYASARDTSYFHVFADQETSSPIIAKMGFKRVETITYYQLTDK